MIGAISLDRHEVVDTHGLMEKYCVQLTNEEILELRTICSKGKHSARKIRKANILLQASEDRTDDEIAQTLKVGHATIQRTRRRFIEGNLKYALDDCPRDGRPKIFDGIQEAALVALACTKPPEGHCVWTIELLVKQMILLGVVDNISSTSVRIMLKRNELKPWQKQEWCIPKINADYIWRMEDVLELYADPFDPNQPVVCFDETPYQLIEESRQSIPMKPGQPLRQDHEYKRKGTANLFLLLQPRAGWRHVKITLQRKKDDFACCLLDLATVHFPNAQKIHLVLDNLNTHSPSTLYEILPPQEARSIIRRLEFHYTPKHGSWLNMAEIEFSVLRRQCLNKYIPNIEILENEIYAWENEKNVLKSKVDWTFAVEDAREKMGHLYPKFLNAISKQVEKTMQSL